jgi:hypothetical protein
MVEGDSISFHVRYSIDATDGNLTFRALKLGALPARHRQYVTVLRDGATLAEQLLSAKSPTLSANITKGASRKSR